ncbi:MAG: HlyD family efflux transporter periplasmic adaptor subunit [Myxococcota bacterium]|nr:HlyD family efflux transporter periplasmic adaptor subunit [Myxococcota bacterium]
MTPQRILRFLLPVIVVVGGAGAYRALVLTRPEAERAEAAAHTTPVTVMIARADDHPIVVRAQGSVGPSRELVLQAELNGRVLWRHPDLVPGGLVRAGDTLVRIDPRDFRAAVAQQSAALESQRVQMQTEERRSAVAQREWEILSRQSAALQSSPEGRSLAMREPQMRSAEASIDATEAQLRHARLTLTRTTLRAPFEAVVREADVEVGQLVGPSARLATLVATDHFWVQVSLPIDSLSAIHVPSPGAGQDGGSAVRVHQVAGDGRIERSGRIIRLLGDLDPIGRMARVLVEIDDPLGLRQPDVATAEEGEARHSGLPMLLGAYVHVEIDAGTSHGAIEMPRAALRQGDVVWLVVDDRLVMRRVQVVWRRDDTVLIGDGLGDGDRVVVSPLASPVEGMPLRVLDATPTPTPTAAAAPAPEAP